MNLTHYTLLGTGQKERVLNLWNSEYPVSLNYKSITALEAYLSELTDQNHLLTFSAGGIITGWYMDFLRDNERWFAIIIDSQHQGKGLGAKLLHKAKETHKELNGWVIDHSNELKKNGEPYTSPLAFYLNHNFKLIPDVRLETEQLSAVKIRWRKA